MPPPFSVTQGQRELLLQTYRKSPDPEVRFRAHIILLLAEGYTWEEIAAVLFCSSRTIDRWRRRFEGAGIEGLAGHRRGRPCRARAGWAAIVIIIIVIIRMFHHHTGDPALAP
jgi:putative transposase